MASPIPVLHPALRTRRPAAGTELAPPRADSGADGPAGADAVRSGSDATTDVRTAAAEAPVHGSGRDLSGTGTVNGATAERPAALDWRTVPGAEWDDDQGRHLKRFRTGVKARNADGKWVFVADPCKTPKPESLARRQRKQRAARGESTGLPRTAYKSGRGLLPIENVSEEDRLKIKLRDKQRAMFKQSGEATQTLVTLPGEHLLSLATRYIDGGRDRFVQFVQYAALDNHPAAVAWFAVYADLTPTERDLVSFDDICVAAGVRPSDLMSLVVKTAMEYGRDVGNLVAAATHPKIVAKAAESAQRIDGDYAELAFRDRQALFQHHNFLPLPRGVQVNVNANASASAQAAAAAKAEPTMPSFTADLAKADAIQRKLQGVAPPVEAVLISPDDADSES